jgi:hypothetical protein
LYCVRSLILSFSDGVKPFASFSALEFRIAKASCRLLPGGQVMCDELRFVPLKKKDFS